MMFLLSLIVVIYTEDDSKQCIVPEIGIYEECFHITYVISYESPFSTLYYKDLYTTSNVSWFWLEDNGYVKDGEFHITKSMTKRDLKEYGLYNSEVLTATIKLEAYY